MISKHMKVALLCYAILMLCLFGCTNGAVDGDGAQTYPTFTFTHYSSGSTQEEYKAEILFEQSASTSTSFHVALLSRTCSDAIAKYYSVCYDDRLNNKHKPDESAIRAIILVNEKGLRSDNKPNHNSSCAQKV